MSSTYNNTILITGGTSGLGYQCTLCIAKQCPQSLIICASRTDPHSVASRINKTLGQTNVKYLPLDLSSRATVRSFATSWLSSSYPPIQALVLNAGLQFLGDVQYNSDGIEKTFAINHVGHALLFHLLTPSLTPNARIVVVSSGTHDPAQKTGLYASFPSAEGVAHPSQDSQKQTSKSDADGPMAKLNLGSSGRGRYATSKLCNVLWTKALAVRFEEAGSARTVVTMNPGLMPGTGLARDAGPVARFVFVHILPFFLPLLRWLMGGNRARSPKQSGADLAHLVVEQDLVGKNGCYFNGTVVVESSKESMVKEKQEDLWNWTVNFVGESEEEKTRFRRAE